MLQKFRGANANEKGFTLIELLVVMIIIGILAAIAIPIFSNQRKTARDTSTKSDVRNIAGEVQGLLVGQPDADEFSITEPVDGIATLTVGVTGKTKTSQVSVTKGSQIVVSPGATSGSFVVCGLNPGGKMYATEALVYDNSAGGLMEDTMPLADCGTTTPGGGTPGGGTPGGGGTPFVGDGSGILAEPTGLRVTPYMDNGDVRYLVEWDAPTVGDYFDNYLVGVVAETATGDYIGLSEVPIPDPTATSLILSRTWYWANPEVPAKVHAYISTGYSVSYAQSNVVYSPDAVDGLIGDPLSEPNAPTNVTITPIMNPTTNEVDYLVEWTPATTTGGTFNGYEITIMGYASAAQGGYQNNGGGGDQRSITGSSVILKNQWMRQSETIQVRVATYNSEYYSEWAFSPIVANIME